MFLGTHLCVVRGLACRMFLGTRPCVVRGRVSRVPAFKAIPALAFGVNAHSRFPLAVMAAHGDGAGAVGGDADRLDL